MHNQLCTLKNIFVSLRQLISKIVPLCVVFTCVLFQCQSYSISNEVINTHFFCYFL
jgi:hypothetical protein